MWKNSTRSTILAAALFASAVSAQAVLSAEEEGLGRKLESDYPIDLLAVPPEGAIPFAVRWISSNSRLLVGLEEASAPFVLGGAGPPSDLRGLTVRDALDAIVAFDPRYSWKMVDDVAVIRPVSAWEDCSHFLNRSVSVLRRDLQTMNAILLLFSLIDPSVPKTPERTRPGLMNATPFDVDVSGTILDVFNAIATSGRMSWGISYASEKADGKKPVTIELRALDGPETGLVTELKPLAAKCVAK